MNDPNKNRRGELSSGEVFVAVNLLSKIGIVFVILSVIAFSAASEGHIPDPVRLALVLIVGAIMLGAGELFWRKGSRVFSGSMIFGGAVELMICAPIGRYFFGVFDNTGMLIYSAVAAAVGFRLALRYKSQGLTIIMVIVSMIPVVPLVTNPLTAIALPAYLVISHAFNSVISRRCGFNGAIFTGIGAVVIEAFFVMISSAVNHNYFISTGGFLKTNLSPLITIVFIACCGLCYSGGALLNAIEDDGEISANDCAALCASQGVMIFFAAVVLMNFYGKLMGVVMLLSALLYTLTAVLFSLRFWSGCKTNTALINLTMICTELALFFLIHTGNIEYIMLHVFAAAILIAGSFLERRLFKGWGYALLIIAELRFFIVLAVSGLHPESYKLSAAAVNLILWFGIMAVLSTRKERESTGFRIYSFAALLNAGILGSNLIISDLMNALKANGMILEKSQLAPLSGLLCSALWMLLGFVAGKLAYLNEWRFAASIAHYAAGFVFLAWANLSNTIGNLRGYELGAVPVIATIAVNIASVLAVLDIVIQISEKSSKFSRAVGLIVSGYAMLTLTTLLGTNNTVRFTSCIISIIYLVMAAAWIIIGFWKSNPLLRRFGLALALFSSAKLFLFDFSGVDAFGRTILFIGFGITLLGISLAYAIMEKRFSQRKK
ncbi:MAG: DUF2339 domain-containing protein [Oscillospiraceae bacterium]|nr:DUF2339 domain-containing protein [Oscillospiraceae bacterium]